MIFEETWEDITPRYLYFELRVVIEPLIVGRNISTISRATILNEKYLHDIPDDIKMVQGKCEIIKLDRSKYYIDLYYYESEKEEVIDYLKPYIKKCLSILENKK